MQIRQIASLLALCLTTGCVTSPIDVTRGRHIDPSPSRTGEAPKPIDQPIYLPAPKPSPKAETYSVVVTNTPVRELLFALARDAKINVDVHPLVSGRVTINALNQTLPQLLSRISQQVDMHYSLEGNVLQVRPDQAFLKTYKVDYVNMSRSLKGTVTIATTLAAAGGGVTRGNPSSTTECGGKLENCSLTEVTNAAENKFWERLNEGIRNILDSSNKVSATQKEQMEALEAAEAGKSVELSVRKAEKDKQEREERLKAAQAVASAGAGAPALLSQVLGNDAKAAGKDSTKPQQADANKEKDPNVTIHPETGIVTVNATHRQHEKIQEFINLITESARRQVMIEATIVEVELNDQYQAGVDWSRVGDTTDNQANIAQVITAASLQTAPVTILSYTKKASSLLRGDLTATVRLLEQFGKAKVLSSPKIMALNNQPAILKVVDEKVYFTTAVEVREATSTSPERREYKSEIHTVPVGVVMNVTPQISNDDTVSINVRPTISRIIGYRPDPGPRLGGSGFDNQIPEIQVREIESTLKLSNGQVAVLGGLIQDSVQDLRNGVPFLSRVPGIGELFAARNDVGKKNELVIFIRPTIVRDPSLNTDLKEYAKYQPQNDFFEKKEDEISVFKSGLPSM
ncbi:pilus (MSHA type) biogenesis protein MshL [Parachitinimonas caeni]|uniref:Pilus (MSHA type) biogenesis protein MshL n=1 Tax=Parachitinimonas caeni TaxID=3031301 RepID=A0ABT7DT73_9NEIS|nr:pilus (MSHA type) biogenesis protein MshL [Parachitinimonas caeni]MDK2123164.1 pilus (MSHA type) biogenesis protein MshL [Parachitinimonas caeni]